MCLTINYIYQCTHTETHHAEFCKEAQKTNKYCPPGSAGYNALPPFDVDKDCSACIARLRELMARVDRGGPVGGDIGTNLEPESQGMGIGGESEQMAGNQATNTAGSGWGRAMSGRLDRGSEMMGRGAGGDEQGVKKRKRGEEVERSEPIDVPAKKEEKDDGGGMGEDVSFDSDW
ncbi:hypothetical protein B9Z65_2454 [Elsinoe australis]|uniref:Uncharacterized protein n=1 Tax=Elsinoe australis TaxID=40998 RepID=A0A2P7ZAT7_9PEZI|nr:hypothetical protein B9Z65_2454 [Elsinoe australis]